MARRNEAKGTTLTADMLQTSMDELSFSTRDVAIKVGTSYEHIRNILRGNAVPAKRLMKDLSNALNIPILDLERRVVADQIRRKYGDIPLEISGKNPELDPIEQVWPKLSEMHKADIIVMAQTFAKLDAEASRG